MYSDGLCHEARQALCQTNRIWKRSIVRGNKRVSNVTFGFRRNCDEEPSRLASDDEMSSRARPIDSTPFHRIIKMRALHSQPSGGALRPADHDGKDVEAITEIAPKSFLKRMCVTAQADLTAGSLGVPRGNHARAKPETRLPGAGSAKRPASVTGAPPGRSSLRSVRSSRAPPRGLAGSRHGFARARREPGAPPPESSWARPARRVRGGDRR